jgi:hypothetical protein
VVVLGMFPCSFSDIYAVASLSFHCVHALSDAIFDRRSRDHAFGTSSRFFLEIVYVWFILSFLSLINGNHFFSTVFD